ncbi:cytochrome b/b6 domain-containing protein [Rhizobium miluonense]|uniref:cytochrome b/b6 domain-containing protein n=1 Tax=Rhizobium miluonense TaxID=411945 RepID=UPI003CCA4DA4
MAEPVAARQVFGEKATEIPEHCTYCLYAVVGLHILAALWHHLLRRDEVLRRML